MSPKDNFSAIRDLAKNVIQTDIMVLPEMFNTGFCVEEPQVAEGMDGDSIRFMKALAADHDCAVAGSLMVVESGKIYNRFVIVDSTSVLKKYDKMHLFKLSDENEHFTAGSEQIDFTFKGFKIRTVVCYDIRFPYICFNNSDYDVLLVVANWPVKRIHHWDALLQARAIENQAFLIAVNRVGVDPFGVEYPGHSSVYDGLGNCMLKFTGETLKSVLLDKSQLRELRTKLPFIEDRKS